MMRAKMSVREVKPFTPPNVGVTLSLYAVTSKPFGPDGESEDNTYAKWTPTANLSMTITNPALADKFAVGDTFYVDFTKVD